MSRAKNQWSKKSMEQKIKKLYIVFSVLIAIFAVLIVNKGFQNDTFFIISIGNHVLQYGITTEEYLSWHKDLEFKHSGVFGVILAIVYNIGNFTGVYVFTIIMTSLIGLTLFNILLKRKNNIVISLFTTLTAMYFSKDAFVARGQIVSYLMFIIEVYLIEMLLETDKKRYCVELILVSIIIVNFHSSVWPIYFVLFMPYIAEYMARKLKLDSKIFAESFNIKLLLITFGISIFTGLLNPVGLAPYTDMINVMSGISTQVISELSRTNIVEDIGMFISLGIYILLISFEKAKIKLSDFFMITGLYIMGLMAVRNTPLLYLIGAISYARIITSIVNTTDDIKIITNKLNNKNSYIAIFCLTIVILAFFLNCTSFLKKYVDEEKYPVQATEYILKNIEINDMRIFNHFNFGSYLEFKGIPAFIDSRSGVFCAEFNDTSILEDWTKCAYFGECNYREIFEKYDITHALLYKNEIINTYICEDTDYKKIYEDENFALYEKIN